MSPRWLILSIISFPAYMALLTMDRSSECMPRALLAAPYPNPSHLCKLAPSTSLLGTFLLRSAPRKLPVPLSPEKWVCLLTGDKLGLVPNHPGVPFIRILVLQVPFHYFFPRVAGKCLQKDAILSSGLVLEYWASHKRNS